MRILKILVIIAEEHIHIKENVQQKARHAILVENQTIFPMCADRKTLINQKQIINIKNLKQKVMKYIPRLQIMPMKIFIFYSRQQMQTTCR
jgi:division protein CdvB (Snf7/Vps24/ESCRT-III family)